jgi:integrase
VAGFASWCASVGLTALPAEATTVALYLTARARSHAVSTLALHLAAIAASHQAAGLPPPAHPDLDRVWAGIRRTHGRPPRKKRALVVEDLRRALAKLPATLTGIRDRALILVGFAGALRRSELAALTLDGEQRR